MGRRVLKEKGKADQVLMKVKMRERLAPEESTHRADNAPQRFIYVNVRVSWVQLQTRAPVLRVAEREVMEKLVLRNRKGCRELGRSS